MKTRNVDLLDLKHEFDLCYVVYLFIHSLFLIELLSLSVIYFLFSPLPSLSNHLNPPFNPFHHIYSTHNHHLFLSPTTTPTSTDIEPLVAEIKSKEPLITSSKIPQVQSLICSKEGSMLIRGVGG